MNRLIVWVACLLAANCIEAQNLVPNPGFEFFFEHPSSFGQISRSRDWYSGNGGTPEYYRTDSDFRSGKAESGKGYAGLILYGDYPKAIEYLVVKLDTTLIQDQTYCLSFDVRAEESFISIDQIGMLLSVEDPSLGMWAPIYTQPTLTSPMGEPIVHQIGWMSVEGEYVAQGGEEYASIGNFLEPEKHMLYVDEFVHRERGWNSYYYIDNVVVKLKTPQGCIVEPAKEIATIAAQERKLENDTLVVYFAFDSFELSMKEQARIVDWYTKLNHEQVANFRLSGHCDSKGSDSYNEELSQQRVEVAAEYLNQQVASSIPRKLNYFGETKPIDSNASEEGRAINRRVEIIVSYHDRKGK